MNEHQKSEIVKALTFSEVSFSSGGIRDRISELIEVYKTPDYLMADVVRFNNLPLKVLIFLSG